MATELPPVVVSTPTDATVVQPVIKRPILGRVLDATVFLAVFLTALLDTLGEINFANLGFTPKQAAWAALLYPAVRFALAYRVGKLVEMRSEPAPSRGGPN